MTTAVLSVCFENGKTISKVIISIIFLFILGGVALLISGKPSYAVVCLGIPIIVAFISHPRAAIYLYIFSMFIFIYPTSSSQLLLIDIVAIVLLVSFGVDFLLKGRISLKIPSIVKYGLILLTALVIASIFATHPEYSYSPLIRVALQLAIIIAIYNLIFGKDVLILLKLYFWLMVFHSICNFCSFIVLGGEYRVFGFPGVYYDDLAMLAFPIGLAYYIWSEKRSDSLLYGLATVLIIFGLLATHSRGPMLTIVWAGFVMLVYSRRKAKVGGIDYVRSRIRKLFLGITPILIILIGFTGIFRFALERFQSLGDIHSGTIWYRFSLWKASLTSFMSNPFSGIGPGNFRYIESILPSLRFNEGMIYVHGLSAHNMFLHYLAESGLIGAAALIAYYLKNFTTSKNIEKFNSQSFPLPASIAILGVGMTLFFSIFYMDGWGWGQNAFAAPFFFAITAKAANSKFNA